MHHTLPVGFIQGIGNLDGVLQGLLQEQWAFRQPRLQCLPYQVFHDQVVDAVLLSDVIKSADMRMIEAGNGSCFAFKAFPQLGSV